ncbi:hypothetical protein [Aminobacter aminovorans]|uniref:Uncharacterized protein n=1 Tax=Aminobacter aminovorans TaxID=83263 RepID=A0AAC8YN26_AMIAI|nr:hypothetical protein [Aminobacter aminovorans]AMS41183.1 hypothetical protein AA2016_2255 [Aminobacter aminovorans]MBB3705834.1 hypothetical protein [Aminobacter aminovorans]
MNEVNARAVPVMGGFEGQFRKVHKAAWESVCINGVAQLYPTQFEAETMAWRALHSHLCGVIVGTGDKVSPMRSKAEAQFGAIFKKGRKIEVERR